METKSDVDLRYLVGYFTDNELPLYPVKTFFSNFHQREEVEET